MLNELPLLLAAAEVAHGAEEASGGLGALAGTFGLNLKLILAQALNFIIVATLLWRFAFKPVMATMEEREAKIADGLRFAEEAKQQLESAEKEKAEKLKEAHLAAQSIAHEAKAQSEAFSAKQKEVLEHELSEKRRRAGEALELEREKVLNDARADIARLVVLTSGKVLAKELSSEEKSRLNAAASREMAALN